MITLSFSFALDTLRKSQARSLRGCQGTLQRLHGRGSLKLHPPDDTVNMFPSSGPPSHWLVNAIGEASRCRVREVNKRLARSDVRMNTSTALGTHTAESAQNLASFFSLGKATFSDDTSPSCQVPFQFAIVFESSRISQLSFCPL